MIAISSITTYPVKSTAGWDLEDANVTSEGLEYDRKWLLLNNDNQVMTGREYPQMLRIQAVLEGGALRLSFDDEQFELDAAQVGDHLAFELWHQPVEGLDQGDAVNAWLSERLGVSCHMIAQQESIRPIPEKPGAVAEGNVSYADQAPILLLSEGSVKDLNSRLESTVSTRHFRPNIVVRGAKAYEEDQWQRVRIGDCEFDVLEACKRCVFITIDPDTLQRDAQQEPLRTLATYRKHARGSVAFGVHLVPRRLGKISIGDKIEIIK